MRNKILIYNDIGTADITNLQNSLKRYFEPDGVSIQLTTADAIIRHNALTRNVLAFFMPGGRATPYMEKLKTLGNHKIAEYVLNGGIYFGICAGAYYASREVSFEQNIKELAVIQQCGLNLIDAKAIGTLYKELNISPYTSDFSSFAVARVRWLEDNESHVAGYHGGPYFAPLPQSRMKILAEYDLGTVKLPAVVIEKHGAGAAIVSGLHIEDSGYDMRRLLNKAKIFSNKSLQAVAALEQGENSRQALFYKLMSELKNRS